MRIFDTWQEQLRLRTLRKAQMNINVHRQPVSFSEAQRIGVFFEATDLMVRSQALTFIQQMEQSKKRVTSLGYFDGQQQKTDHFSFKTFTKSELDWLGRPRRDIISTYTEPVFDFLICIYQDQCHPLDYLAALSSAHCRIGSQAEQAEYYDLIIDTSSKEIRTYLKEVAFYLNKINQKYEPSYV